MRVSIHIATKDRHSELALLLQSLRTQLFQDFDILIYDQSTTPITQCHYLMCLINRMKLEKHAFKIVCERNTQGVCGARNKLIEIDDFENEMTFRCDDDVILDEEYIDLLFEGIGRGYDAVSGVVPLVVNPVFEREASFVGDIMNYHEFDAEGNLIVNKDECWACYDKAEIKLTPHFRTNLLYKSEMNKKVSYPKFLSPVGFREEGFFSFKAILEGYTIAVHTKAVAYHLQTPSGGCRHPNYPALVKQDDERFKTWLKEKYQQHGDFLKEYYNKKVN